MNARPVRGAVTSTAARGVRPRRRSSTNRSRISDVNSVQAATTSGPPTAVIGLSLRLSDVGEQRRGADRDQHRHEREQRPDDAAQPDREEQEDEEDREVGEQDPVRLEVVEQADADDREARRRRADARRRLAPSCGSRARPRPRGRRARSVRCGRSRFSAPVPAFAVDELDVLRRDVVRGLHLVAGGREVRSRRGRR